MIRIILTTFIFAVFCLSLARADVTIYNDDGGGVSYLHQYSAIDANGNHMIANDGQHIEQFPGNPLFYWYSPNWSHGFLYFSGGGVAGPFSGYAVYTSPDFVNWTLAGESNGMLFDASGSTYQSICTGTSSPYWPACSQLGGMKYNASTGKYVALWANNNNIYTLQCDRPTGGCDAAPHTTSCTSGYAAQIFVDGVNGYVTSTATSLAGIIQGLTSDWTDCTGPTVTINSPTTPNREGTTVFKNGSLYYAINGNACGYCNIGSTQSYYYTATSPLGTWSSGTIIDDSSNTCGGQIYSAYHYVMNGSDVYLLGIQRWDPGNSPPPLPWGGTASQGYSNRMFTLLTFTGTSINVPINCASSITLPLTAAPPPFLSGVDQTDENNLSKSICDIAGNKQRYQTFTPSVAAPLSQIWLEIGQGNEDCELNGLPSSVCPNPAGVNSDLTVELVNDSGGTPGSVISTMTVPALNELWTTSRHKIPVPGTPRLTPGTTYGMLLKSPAATIGCWSTQYNDQNTYGRGQMHLSTNGGSTWSPVAATSMMFSTLPNVIDPITPTLTGPADVATRRTQLINLLWGTPTLPTTLPTVTTGISNPFPSYNVARVDQYIASMSNGQTNTSNLYLANSPNNNRVVILNPGHQDTCDWTAFSPGYNMQPMLQELLAAGYSVFAMNMPGCGDVSVHQALFTSYGNTAMSYFFEPAVQAMNYWEATYTFRDYNMVGLSGGGWTTTVLPALDTRIKISIPVAGSWPGIIFQGSLSCADGICGDECSVLNCAEQNWTNFFTVAGYIDLYLMSSYGSNRRQFQILNYSDDCCFGNSFFTGSGAAALYGVDFPTFVRNYAVAAKQLEASVVRPTNYDVMIDYIANQHQISTNAQQVILSILASVGPGNAGGGRRLLHMW